MNSAIYRGWVRHRRLAPVQHEFTARLFMLYLDLDELPGLFDGRWLWSARRIAPAWFRRADYLGDARRPLRACVEEQVHQRIGWRPAGPIRLLTHLRYFGYCLNPVSFYYCFDDAGTRVRAILAEITNTPWGERHQYVIDAGPDAAALRQPMQSRFDKEFHISPFMGMQQTYHWRFTEPRDALLSHMRNFENGSERFNATLSMRREPITSGSLARCLARHPLMTLEVAGKIYWQAARLWLKGAEFHAHPRHARPALAHPSPSKTPHADQTLP